MRQEVQKYIDTNNSAKSVLEDETERKFWQFIDKWWGPEDLPEECSHGLELSKFNLALRTAGLDDDQATTFAESETVMNTLQEKAQDDFYSKEEIKQQLSKISTYKCRVPHYIDKTQPGRNIYAVEKVMCYGVGLKSLGTLQLSQSTDAGQDSAGRPPSAEWTLDTAATDMTGSQVTDRNSKN